MEVHPKGPSYCTATVRSARIDMILGSNAHEPKKLLVRTLRVCCLTSLKGLLCTYSMFVHGSVDGAVQWPLVST